MISAWWSVALATVGIAGCWLTGQKDRRGWLLGVAVQALWLTYAVATGQWGFIASALAYGFVCIRGWYRWRREAAAE